MDIGKVATGAAVLISSTAIIIAVITTVQMHNEITEMYKENMIDIFEFNVS